MHYYIQFILTLACQISHTIESGLKISMILIIRTILVQIMLFIIWGYNLGSALVPIVSIGNTHYKQPPSRISLMSIKKINGYKIMIDAILGQGAYGTVYRGEKDDTKQQCAVKIVEKNKVCKDPYLKSALDSQIFIMSNLKSVNIIRFFDVLMSSHNYYIIQELCDGDLEHYLADRKRRNQKVEESTAVKFLTQICNGFMTLVKEGIVHRDLKPANLLLSKGCIKIGDFGFAKANAHKKVKNQSCVGTPLYMSIEVLKSVGYTSKCDIWSIGCIFYQILHGATPWNAKSQYELVQNIQTKPLCIDKSLSANTKDFLRKALEVKEQDRICWDDLFKHPIFDGFFDQFIHENIELEDKYKKVMSDLRFKVNSQNINLELLWKNLGFEKKSQINFGEFQNFLQTINLRMIKWEQRYFFEKLDPQGKGYISLTYFSKQLQNNSITTNSRRKSVAKPLNVKTFESMNIQSLAQIEQKTGSPQWDDQFDKKVRACFLKLHQRISDRNLSLEKTFAVYDRDGSGQLTIDEFSTIIKRLDPTFTIEQVQAVFNFIDSNGSKSVEFDELNTYYCKVNGLPNSQTSPSRKQINKNEDDKQNSFC